MTAKFRTTRRATLAGLVGARSCGGGAARADARRRAARSPSCRTPSRHSLISLTNVATPSLTVSAKTTEGLLEYDYDINPRPALATEWSISPDGLTLHLQAPART